MFGSGYFAVEQAGLPFEDDVLDCIDKGGCYECSCRNCRQIHAYAVQLIKEIQLIDQDVVQHYDLKRDLAEELYDGIADLNARHYCEDKDQEDNFKQGLHAQNRNIPSSRWSP